MRDLTDAEMLIIEMGENDIPPGWAVTLHGARDEANRRVTLEFPLDGETRSITLPLRDALGLTWHMLNLISPRFSMRLFMDMISAYNERQPGA